MKKFILGLVLGAVLFIPSGVLADRLIKTPTTNPIYDINTESDISVFDDQDNKCYVAGYGTTDQPTISCVKETQ